MNNMGSFINRIKKKKSKIRTYHEEEEELFGESEALT